MPDVHHITDLGPVADDATRAALSTETLYGIDPGTRVYLGVTMQHHRHFAYEGVPVVTPDGAEFGLRFTTFTFHEGGLQ